MGRVKRDEATRDEVNSDEVDSDERRGRLIVVSNRLPMVLTQQPGGEWQMEPGSGGLVTAMEPVLEEVGGLWIGWPGVDPEAMDAVGAVLERESKKLGYDVMGVGLSPRERDDFYLGFSNQVIWPLFHDFQSQCNFDPAFRDAYRSVNRKFAEVVAREVEPEDFVWAHDYHLMALAEELREKGVEGRLGFFLHIPFPPADFFVKLPWRFGLLKSLLHYDLIGFQTERDRTNFLQCVRSLMPDSTVEGEGRVVTAHAHGHTVRVGVFPISIDVEDFVGVASSEAVSQRVAEIWSEFPGRQIILGVDRLDYSKGIPHKLQGFRLALKRYPELKGRVSLVQLVVPSREGIPEYDEMKREIERLVGQISGEFTRPGWVPIHYQYGTWDREELVAHYRAAHVALVTPLKDGMNLVAKEYCACSLEGNGVLILSEHAGSTAQLQNDALLVNPYDVEGVAEAIHRACTMPQDERRQRMQRMREKVRQQDIYWWVDTFRRAVRREELGDTENFDVYPPPSGARQPWQTSEDRVSRAPNPP